MTSKKDRISQSDEHNARGIELADRGWLDEAVNEFTKAIELDPDSAHAYDNLATVFAEKGRFIDALEAYLKAVRLEPQNPNTHHYLASFLSSRGFDASVQLTLTWVRFMPARDPQGRAISQDITWYPDWSPR